MDECILVVHDPEIAGAIAITLQWEGCMSSPPMFLTFLFYFRVYERLIHTEEGELAGGDQLAVLAGDVHRHQRGGLSPVPDLGLRLHNALGLVPQEMQSAGLGHMVPSIRMGGKPGRIIRHGINGAAVDHTEGVFALRADLQPENRPVLFHGHHFNVIMHHKSILLLFVPHYGSKVFHIIPSVCYDVSVYHKASPFSTFFKRGVDKCSSLYIMNI